jgi:N-acetylmuramic acid 6-phosphate (MurNAc-6-P) etherase
MAAAGWDLKLALVMSLCQIEAAEARRRLDQSGGRVKAAVQGSETEDGR